MTELQLSVLNPDGVTFGDHITDKAELSALLDRIVTAISIYGIEKIGCYLLDEEDRLDVHIVCVKPGADVSDYVWRD